jgi:hypothetical protein
LTAIPTPEIEEEFPFAPGAPSEPLPPLPPEPTVTE